MELPLEPRTTKEDPSSETLGFITELVIRMAEPGGLSSRLPSLLEFIGQNLGTSRITLSLNEEKGTQEFSWINNQLEGLEPQTILQFGSKENGDDSWIKFYVPEGSEDNRALYVLVSTLMEKALATHQLIQAEYSQRQLAESINDISKILTSTLDRDELFSLFLDQLEKMIPYDSANVMLLRNGLLHMHAARGYPVDSSTIYFDPQETFPLEDVLAGNKPYIIEDTRKAPRWIVAPTGGHIRSWMGVPLRVKGNVVGLFSIDKSIPNFFTAKHAQLASALSKYASLALDNALLFTQVQEAHEQLRALSARIVEAQEKERQKIAMELHDHTGQALLALRAELRVLQHHSLNQPEQAIQQIEYLDQIVLELSKDLSQLAYDLRPPTLTALGLISALEEYITDFSRRMDVQADFVHESEFSRLPEEVELVCYRIVQEALTNLVKHAQANKVEITLNEKDGTLTLVVKDNGIGFTNSMQRTRRGFGLLGIRERLLQINGALEIHSQPGKGTELIVTIPVPNR